MRFLKNDNIATDNRSILLKNKCSHIAKHLHLFRIGRMEYKIEPFPGDVVVYRNVVTGKVIALAMDGARFNRDGYIDAARDSEGDDGWTAVYRATL